MIIFQSSGNGIEPPSVTIRGLRLREPLAQL
jgi:hypothetical protein